MVFRFSLTADESEVFSFDILIDADATFEDLRHTILYACRYSDTQPTAFALADEDWNETQRITNEDMHDTSSFEDCYLMRDTVLSDLLEDEDQHLTFLFDPENGRRFYMELKSIDSGLLDEPECRRMRGSVPPQSLGEEDDSHLASTGSSSSMDEEFFGSEDFDSEELDLEGMEISDGE